VTTARRSFVAAILPGLLLASCATAPPPPAIQPASAAVSADQPAAGVAGLVPSAADAEHVSRHAYVLLDRIGGRMSGQPSGDSAQQYAYRVFREYGLHDVRLEPFPLIGWERGPASMTVESPAALRGRDVAILSLGHVGPGEVAAELIDAGYGTAEEITALGARVRGKIVLVRVGQPQGYGRSVHRTEKLGLAHDAGAVGFVMVAPEPGTLVQVGTATIGDEAAPVPAVAANYETGMWLLRVLEAGGEPVVARIVTGNRMGPAEAANVLGDVRGSGTGVVLAGAHLDSWDLATGALDNGSGTLVVLEAARILSDHVRRTGERPRRTIRFALWMGEELGLYGSRHHVADAGRDGRLEEYRAVLNLDMVGAPVGFGAMGRPEAASVLRPLVDALAARGTSLDTTVATGGGLYSDHQPFLLRGVPILSLRTRWVEGAGRYYHSAGDTRDKIDEQGLAESGAVVAAMLWHLASLPEWPLTTWSEAETGRRLEAMGLRDPLERGGEWRWE
jgi:carboxypeptidase Q